MGLDMYLSEGIHLAHYQGLAESYETYRAEFDTAEKVFDALGMPRPTIEGSVEVKVTVMYWRKTNAIHNWFVQNVQDGVDDCGHYEVTENQLIELRDLCKQVLRNRSVGVGASEILPPTSGFFFGSTEIDDWYWKDLEATVEGIDTALANKLESSWFEYHSSW